MAAMLLIMPRWGFVCHLSLCWTGSRIRGWVEDMALGISKCHLDEDSQENFLPNLT